MAQRLPLIRFQIGRFGLINLLLWLALSSLTGVLANPPGAAISPNIKVDQFGYPVNARKIAIISNPIVGYNKTETFTPGLTYQVRRWDNDAVVFTGAPAAWKGGQLHAQSGDKVWWFDFSNVTTPGEYYVLDVEKNSRSESFRIGNDVYDEVMKAALKTFYYQRSGYRKTAEFAGEWVDEPAFVGPGQDTEIRLVTDKGNPATQKDLSGGWFDAGDYNKYVNFTFSVMVNLLTAYEERPTVFGDNNAIPESGNGVPDILDEAKWELDWLLKMQQADGSVLSKVAVTEFQSASPPSATTAPRYYERASTSATLTTASIFALAARQYKSLSDPAMQSYGNRLQAAAILAYNWAAANPNVLVDNTGFQSASTEVTNYGRTALRITAATFLFALTGETTYRDFVDANYETLNVSKASGSFVYPYEQGYQDAVLYYAKTPGATPSVVSNIRSRYESGVKNSDENFGAYLSQEDAYRSFLKDGNYTWGSNQVKSHQGLIFYNMVQAGLDPENHPRYEENAIGYVHYMHGLNPTGYTYLTNMDGYGAEKSVTRAYHNWFGDVGDPRFAHNPPPGYLTGGPNPTYQPDQAYNGPELSPPLNQPVQKSYIDWDKSYPENGWQITEPGIYYQASYIRALSKAMGGVLAPIADAIPPSKPTSLTSTDRSLTAVTLNWTASTDNVDVTAYEIYNNGTKIGESTTNRFEASGLAGSTTYTFTVRAKDRAGNLSEVSDPTSVTTLTADDQAPTTPTGLAITGLQSRQFALNWTASTDNIGVTGYEIFQDGVKIGESTTTTFAISGLVPSTLYTLTVKAKDVIGNLSAASAELRVTTAANPVDVVLYDEALLAGWINSSTAAIDLASTSPVKVGSRAAKITFGSAGQGFVVAAENASNALQTANFPKGLGFWTYVDGADALSLNVSTQNASGVGTTPKTVSIPAGVWTYVRVSWADLGSPAEVSRVNLVAASAGVISIDDLRLLGNEPNDLVIYDDTVNEGWYDISWASPKDFASTSPVKVGQYAAKINFPSLYLGFGFRAAAGPIQTADFAGGIAFWAYNGGTEPIRGNFVTEYPAGTINPVGKELTFPVGEWTYVKLSWADLGNPALVEQFEFINFTQNSGDFISFDDVRLLKGEQVAPVTFSPNGGDYTTAQVVTLTTATPGATIRYTIDGSTPALNNGTVYTGPITVLPGTTIKAFAYQEGLLSSGLTQATFTSANAVGAVIFSPGSGTYPTPQTVALSTVTTGASIRYTTDGSTPSETAGTLYTSPITVASSLTINAIAYKAGSDNSLVSSATYAIVPINTKDETVYDDELRNGWQNYSYDGKDFDFANTNPVYSGSVSIKAIIATFGYEAAAFNRPTPVSTADYPQGYSFWVYGGTAINGNTTVKLGTYIQTKSDTANLGVKLFEVPVGGWTKVNIPWSDVGNPNQIQYIAIQDQGGLGQVFYIDDVQLLAAEETNTAPTISSSIASQTAIVGAAFSFTLPAATFIDAETPDSLLIAVSGLPTGLTYSNGVISGTPSTSGVSTVTVTATDPGSLSISTQFTLTVNPAVGGPLVLQSPSYNCQSGAITFQYAGGDGSPIEFFGLGVTPGWTTALSHTIDAEKRADPGSGTIITIKARQSGVEYSVDFDFGAYCRSLGTNLAPTVNLSLPSQIGKVGQFFGYKAPNGTFSDPESEPLSLSATGLPLGLAQTPPDLRLISGTPTQPGSFTAFLLATDPQGNTSQVALVITILPADSTNGSLVVAQPIPNQSGRVGQSFSFTILAATFSGPVASVDISDLPSGLFYHADTRTIDGTVNSPDQRYVTITASDGAGNRVQTGFVLTFSTGNQGGLAVAKPVADQTGTIGQRFSFTVPDSTFSGSVASVDVSDLPGGLFYHSNTRTIDGTVSKPDQRYITVTASDGKGGLVQTSFLLKFVPASARRAANEVEIQLETQVYPNPASHEVTLTVRGAASAPLKVIMVNSRGQILQRRDISQPAAVEQLQFDVHGQPAGVLLFQVSSQGHYRAIKVVKQ